MKRKRLHMGHMISYINYTVNARHGSQAFAYTVMNHAHNESVYMK